MISRYDLFILSTASAKRKLRIRDPQADSRKPRLATPSCFVLSFTYRFRDLNKVQASLRQFIIADSYLIEMPKDALLIF